MIEYWSIDDIKNKIFSKRNLKIGDQYYSKIEYRETYIEIIGIEGDYVKFSFLDIYWNGKRDQRVGLWNKNSFLNLISKSKEFIKL